MRRGSAAIFPLIFAVMSLFWFIWFMGVESDNLHKVNKINYLQDIQESLLMAAVQKRYELEKQNPESTKEKLDIEVNKYINHIMSLNKIQE